MANPSTTATMVGVLVGLTIFSASSVAVRVTLKRRQVKPLCWDDAVLVGAWCLFLISFALVAVAKGEGSGRGESEMIRCLAAAEFCAVVAVAAAKTSIGLTLLYAMHNRFQRVVVCSVVALVDAVTVGLAVFLWVTIWRQDVAQICKAGGAPWRAAIFGAVWSASTDFAFSLVPWLFIPRGTSIPGWIGLGLTVSLGIFAGVTAIIKTTNTACDDLGPNITHSVNQLLWTLIEPAVMIIAATIPLIHLLTILHDDGDSQLEPLDPSEHPFLTLAPSISAPAADDDGQRVTWTITGGRFDPFDPENAGIPLQPLGPVAHRTIVRTEAVVVEVEDVADVEHVEGARGGARGRPRARASFPM